MEARSRRDGGVTPVDKPQSEAPVRIAGHSAGAIVLPHRGSDRAFFTPAQAVRRTFVTLMAMSVLISLYPADLSTRELMFSQRA